MPGRTLANGYGPEHKRLRELWRPQVEAGLVTCWRCGKPIEPGAPWDLGHDDDDRTQYRGPEHQGCNRAPRWRRKQQRPPRYGPRPGW